MVDQQAARGVGVRARSLVAGTLASLVESRDFRYLWFSNVAFFGGVWTQTLILGWIVFAQTHSGSLLAVFTAVRLAPMLVGPLSGAIADWLDRRRLLRFACLWAFFASVALSAAATVGVAGYPVLLVGGLVIGLAQSPSQPARGALALEYVGPRNLSNANSFNAIALNMTQFIGPALGGVMISAFGAVAALWVSAAWYAVSYLLLLPLRDPPHAASDSTSATTVGVRGFRLVLASKVAVGALLVTFMANILIWPIYQGFMPVFAVDILRLDAAGLGLLLTCCGAGGMIGSLVIAALGDFRHKGAVFVVGTGVWAAAWVGFGLSQDPGLSFVLMAVAGLASAAFGVLQTTLVMLATPPALQGRALGMQELAIGMTPLASLGLGIEVPLLGLGPATAIDSIVLLVGLGLICLLAPQLIRFDGVGAKSAETTWYTRLPPAVL